MGRTIVRRLVFVVSCVSRNSVYKWREIAKPRVPWVSCRTRGRRGRHGCFDVKFSSQMRLLTWCSSDLLVYLAYLCTTCLYFWWVVLTSVGDCDPGSDFIRSSWFFSLCSHELPLPHSMFQLGFSLLWNVLAWLRFVKYEMRIRETETGSVVYWSSFYNLCNFSVNKKLFQIKVY